MKKLILFFLLISFFIPITTNAALVPCGCDGCPCTLCHFFILINNAINFLVLRLTPIVATLMIVAGGVMFLTSAGKPGTIEKAKSLTTSAIFGLVIIFTAWLVVDIILFYLGWTGPVWWEIDCPVSCMC